MTKATAITVIGTAREELDNKSSFQAIFLAKHPQLQHFADELQNSLILVEVSEYIIADFDETQRVVM